LLIALFGFKIFSRNLDIPIPYTTQLLSLAFSVLITNITLNVIRIVVVSRHRKQRNISNEEHDNFTVGLNALVNIATMLATIIATFIVFDIEFRSFLSSIALVAVALTIIFQDFIKNFLFGFAIMFSTNYEIGDYIQIGEMSKGVVRNITFSSIQLKTESGDLLYIPNIIVGTHEIINFSRLKPKRITTEFHVLRAHLTSVDTFETALLQYLEKKYPGTLEIEKSRLYVKSNDIDGIIFTLDTPAKKASLKLKEEISHCVQKFAVEYNDVNE
jgi:small-conductance mechanosensitive channel